MATFTYCYDIDAKNKEKLSQSRLVKKLRTRLPNFGVDHRFNPGGIAVWGETWVKIYNPGGQPVVEAVLSKDFSYIRQWDGRSSGRNIQIAHDVPKIAELVEKLSQAPFQRF